MAPPRTPLHRKRSIPSAVAMKNVMSGTSATNVAAIADGASSSPQYASAYARPKLSTPRSATPGNADPSGSGIRLQAAKPTRRIPAIAKRSPAPQKGGSSRLLKRTATKFVPPIRTTATNTERTAVDGRFITPTIRARERPYPWPMASRRGATVELREVTKRYGDTVAVDHLSLTAPAGRICVLIGPSGCGKTTSLRMVNRLIEPTSGEILVDGQNILREDPTQLRRRIGYVIQQVGLFPHRTIGENVATVPELLGWPSARIRARVDELLSLIGFDPSRMRDRYPEQLSGGERQRVGVARAMAAEPPLMLMDEPFGAVDPIVRERLQNEFLTLQRAQGITVIFVTHDIDEAIKLGDRVAIMRAGKLVQFAPPGELLARPADDFVAQFVGSDRGLKRLALLTVGGAELDPSVDPSRLNGAPVLSPAMSLRDALAEMLASETQVGMVRDGDRYLGVLTLSHIGRLLRTEEKQ